MLTNLRSYFNFLNLNNLLMFFCLNLLFFLFVKNLAKIHYLSNRHTFFTLLGNHNQIKIYILGHSYSFTSLNNANVFPIMSYQLDMFSTNLLIYERKSLFFTFQTIITFNQNVLEFTVHFHYSASEEEDSTLGIPLPS